MKPLTFGRKIKVLLENNSSLDFVYLFYAKIKRKDGLKETSHILIDPVDVDDKLNDLIETCENTPPSLLVSEMISVLYKDK